MSDNSIGLHVYAIKLYRNRNHAAIPLTKAGDGARVKEFLPKFTKRFSQTNDATDGPPRAWYLEQVNVNGHTVDGIINHGSSGFASDIVDSKSRETQYKRKVTDLEVIPLYYRVWVPDHGQYGLVGLQTFGQRSCVGRFYHAFSEGFRALNEGFRVVFDPVAPAELASYKVGEVKKISLFKHDYTSDQSENLLVPTGDLVDLNLSFQAKPRANLGLLQSLTARVKSRADKSVLEYNDTLFDEATAEIMVGKKRRKVTIVGISKNTGKFDLSEDVKRGADGMPLFSSISEEVGKIFDDIVSG